MGRARLYTKKEVGELMSKHFPLAQNDRGSVYWYCACGAFLDYIVNYEVHVVEVLRRNPGSVEA